MTLTAEQSSNKEWVESLSTADVIDMIRTAMANGCIHPAHVYDLVDEALCRLGNISPQTSTEKSHSNLKVKMNDIVARYLKPATTSRANRLRLVVDEILVNFYAYYAGKTTWVDFLQSMGRTFAKTDVATQDRDGMVSELLSELGKFDAKLLKNCKFDAELLN